MQYDFEKVVRDWESLIPKYPPSLPYNVSLFLTTFSNLYVYLPLITTQSHLVVLFLPQIYRVLIISPLSTISIPFQVIPILHTESQWHQVICYSTLYHALQTFLRFHVAFSAYTAFSHYSAHCTSVSSSRVHTSFPQGKLANHMQKDETGPLPITIDKN